MANQTPYDAVLFSVAAQFVPDIPAHNAILVTLKSDDKEGAKQSFMNWLKSLGLRDEQISSLDIRYQ